MHVTELDKNRIGTQIVSAFLRLKMLYILKKAVPHVCV